MIRWYHWVLLAAFMSVAAGITFYVAGHEQYDPMTKNLRFDGIAHEKRKEGELNGEGKSMKLKVGDFILEDSSDKPPIQADTVEKLYEIYGNPEGFQSKALAEMAASNGCLVVPVEGEP